MTGWLRRLRGAIGMGITWAAAWAAGGIAIGILSNLLPFLPWHAVFRVFDAPLPALAIPGFIAGTCFSVVLSVAARHRRFDELSLPRFIAWGALGGLMLALLPVAMVAVGLASLREGLRVWQLVAVIAPPIVLLSAASAAGSLLLARKAQHQALLDAGIGDVGLTNEEKRELLGG